MPTSPREDSNRVRENGRGNYGLALEPPSPQRFEMAEALSVLFAHARAGGADGS